MEEVDAGRSLHPYSKLRVGIAHRSITEPSRRRESTAASPRRRLQTPHEFHGVVRILPALFPFLLNTRASLRLLAGAQWPLRHCAPC